MVYAAHLSLFFFFFCRFIIFYLFIYFALVESIRVFLSSFHVRKRIELSTYRK